MIKMEKKDKVVMIRIIGLVIFVGMIGAIGYEVFSTVKTSYQISQAKEEQKELKSEKKALKKEISKLKDENYLQSYVSGTIFSTEQGATIFILPEQEETLE